MMRSTDWAAFAVCRVAKTKWPVSAIVSAAPIVSRSLVDDALLVLVEILDRVLDRHDVRAALGVDIVDHRGERRRFPLTGRPRHQRKAARLPRQVLQRRRQVEGLDRGDGHGDDPGRDPDGAALPVDVHAEASQTRHPIREVEFPKLLELLLLERVEHAVPELEGVLGRQHLVLLHWQQFAPHPHRGLDTRREVQVRPLPRHDFS
jgi:hypothetical protein